MPIGRGIGMALVMGSLVEGGAAAQAAHRSWDASTAAWRPAGKGLESSVILGNPETKGAYAIAFRLAPGAWIPPHTHPAPKQVTVIAGALLMGYGERLDSAAVTPLETGQVMVVPAATAHFEGAASRTVVIFSGDGPLVTTWIKQPLRR